ncbi:MAG: tetratricopeptide repeat protein [Betaproteobacteria bacterium]|nr:tetratricopeptide repeat protein [Betaproteobacteria bacterium]
MRELDGELSRAIGLLDRNDIEGAERVAVGFSRHPRSIPYSRYLEALIAEKRGDAAAALARIDAAIEAAPEEPVYWLKAAELCFAQGDYARACEWYERLLGLADQPFRNDPFVLFAAAGAFEKRFRGERAIELLERALAIKPDFETARRNLATLLAMAGESARAREQMDVVLRASPTAAARLKRALMLPAVYRSNAEIDAVRDAFSRELDELLAEAALDLGDADREIGLVPFAIAYHGRNNLELLTKLGRVVRRGYRGAAASGPARRRRGKLRIGFVSTYFHDHSIARTTHGLMLDLPREHFEVCAFAIDPQGGDWEAAIRASADRYWALPDDLHRVRQAMAAAELDMLFYADIGMHPTTYFLAFWRLAPVQLLTWGHPVTSGIDSVDYFVSSEMLEAQENQAHYSETLIRLPGYFMPRYRRPLLGGPRLSRAELGLRADAHLYFCAQTIIKLHPDFDFALKAILERDPRAEILLMETVPLLGQQARSRLAASLGAGASRVRFLPHMPNDRFLQFIAAADVILDTFHFGGNNSSCEALSLGTPMVTLPGDFLGGRFTLGHYREIGIPDCVASSAEDFVRIALRLGTEREYRTDLSRRIAERAPDLFDRPDAARSLGQALLRIAETAP